MSRRLVAVAAAVLVLALAGFVAWRVLEPPSDFEKAMGALPASTLRATYTDWAAVREEADGSGLDAGSPPEQVAAFLRRAFDLDLVSTSAVADSTLAMGERYGLSPLDVAWEALGQDESGQVVVLGVEDDVDLAGVEQSLRSLGYGAPDGGLGSGGTWVGSADLVATIDPSLTPVFQNAVVLPEERMLLLSDGEAAVSRAAEVVAGDEPALDENGLAAAAREPVTAVLWASDFACEDLSMSAADEEDQRVADRLIDRAGGVSPLTGLVAARQPDGVITLALEFESDEQASGNLQPRVDLAGGEAPGQGGSFADRFTVASGKASGDLVLLDLVPDGSGYVFSDLTSGPVLFATC